MLASSRDRRYSLRRLPHMSRCNAAVETAFHCFRECPCNDDIPDEAVESTQALKRAALARHEEFPCLWLRGLLPSCLRRIDDQYLPPDAIKENIVKAPTEGWPSSTYYGDASGGESSSISALRRCGCGKAQAGESGALKMGASFSLRGEIQTVPRGEHFALVYLLKKASHPTEIDYVTNNKGLFDTSNAAPPQGSKSINCYLYSMIFIVTVQKAKGLTVRWTPSHTEGEIPSQ